MRDVTVFDAIVGILIALPFFMWFAVVPLAWLFREIMWGLAGIAGACAALVNRLRRSFPAPSSARPLPTTQPHPMSVPKRPAN
ncbi:MAG: hypothetical protein LBB60_02110 [Desulfovibrio sp.]|jgi:hypothetical protein|nr:hypothetical protein [Desulfovibrio sp.]